MRDSREGAEGVDPLERFFDENDGAAKTGLDKAAWMERYAAFLDAVAKGKARLAKLKRRRGKMDCPCGAEGKTLRLALVGRKDHVRARCDECDRGVME